MSDEERNGIPSAGEVVPSEPSAAEHPVDALSEKLAATAHEVPRGLQDLLPEPSPAVPEEVEFVGSAASEPQPVQEAAPFELPTAPSIFAELKGDTSATIASTSDDRLMSMLAWLTMVVLQLPIVSAIQLLSTNTKDRPFQRHHAVTSLLFYAAGIVYEIVAGILYTILGTVTLGCGFACLWVIFFVPHALALYYGLQAYNGKLLELPVLSNFGRQQKWL
jgi:uncharacterized membrane protein